MRGAVQPRTDYEEDPEVRVVVWQFQIKPFLDDLTVNNEMLIREQGNEAVSQRNRTS